MTKLPTKAVILARGLGTRMRRESPHQELSAEQDRVADKGIKALIPLAGGKTLLQLALDNLRAAGFTEVCLVIGPEHTEIRDFCASRHLHISFAVQAEANGTADAVLAAAQYVGGDELFLSINSDNLYPVESLRRLREAGGPAMLAFDAEALTAKSNIPAEKILKFASLELDSDGTLKRIVEKPDTMPPGSFVSMNAWLFPPEIFAACESIEPSPRGEYEIASAVQFAIDRLGVRFSAIRSDEGVLDLSSRADVASLESHLRRMQQT